MSGKKAKVERYRAPKRTEPEKKVGKGAKAIGPHAWRATFKHERNMVAWLIERLELLEPGLDLYEDVRPGKEYPCKMPRTMGRIDILAQDRRGGLVVIECKLGTAGPRALGQLLGYMGWVLEHLCTTGETVRGMLVVGRASKMLLCAVRAVPLPIAVYECPLRGKLERVA